MNEVKTSKPRVAVAAHPRLVCPKDLGDLRNKLKLRYNRPVNHFHCTTCDTDYPIVDGIPLFDNPPQNKREYLFEMKRYRGIALNPPETYPGYDPDTRNNILKAHLKGVSKYLNTGQGFGTLEELMPKHDKVCLDHCIEFLRYCQSKEIPRTWYVMGFGEQMPFPDGYFPAVVSDSVFQTVTDQREFLIENARVLRAGGLLLLAITYKWNYPRKPQDFPADNPELLIHFLKELGIDSKIRYFDLKTGEGVLGHKVSDYLLVVGRKYSR